jgi:hypothetical protein
MKIEYIGFGDYQGTLNWKNGRSVEIGSNRWEIMKSLIYRAFHEYDHNQPVQEHIEEPNEERTWRKEEEAWTDDDWEREHRQDEIIGMHKDDDKI